jgi:F0F1-type ATP synthase assembly protein I
MNDENRRQRYNSLRQVGLLTTIPLLLLAAPVVGYFIGKQLDHWFKTSFWVWIFSAAGMVSGIREVIGILKRASAEAEAESRRDDDE